MLIAGQELKMNQSLKKKAEKAGELPAPLGTG